MSKSSKTILKYPQFKETIHNYLSMNEFKSKANETIRGHRVTVIGFCNYLGDSGINDLYNEKITLFSGNELFPVIVTNKRDRILSFYSEEEVKSLIACIDNSTPTGKHGPHALRHSLASNLLKNNTPMYVIKDVLGHTNLNTTKVYLNIDFETLKRFALEVPDENKN